MTRVEILVVAATLLLFWLVWRSSTPDAGMPKYDLSESTPSPGR
jgi:hypothetical protein